jgi:hypothetical protein
MAEYENDQQPLGPLTLNQQVAASSVALAEVDRGHYAAARAAVETLHRQLTAGVDPQIAYQRALEAAGPLVTAGRPGSAITAVDIAMTHPDQHWQLHEVAATDHTAAQLAGAELDSATYALQQYKVRTAGKATDRVDVQATVEDIVADLSDRLWAESDQARARYAAQVEPILDAYPTAGPVRGPLATLGYHEGDRGRTLREGEVARRARAAEAEMVSRYFQHEDTAATAIRAFHHEITAGTPAGEAKDQALAEAAAYLARTAHQPPATITDDAVTVTGEDAAEGTAVMQVLQAAETTTAWLAGGELETASDAVDHFRARQVAAAELDPAEAPAYVDLALNARGQAMSRLAGWYREAATLHTAQTRAAEPAQAAAQAADQATGATGATARPEAQDTQVREVAEQVQECGAAVDCARDAVEVAERARHADQTSRQHADQAARDADQTRDLPAADTGLDSGLERS